MAEPSERTPVEEYDAKHGTPGSVPDAPKISEADAFGTTLNPVRETPPAFSNLREVK